MSVVASLGQVFGKIFEPLSDEAVHAGLVQCDALGISPVPCIKPIDNGAKIKGEPPAMDAETLSAIQNGHNVRTPVYRHYAPADHEGVALSI
jgi:hypothetical protein